MNGTCRSSSFVALVGTHLINAFVDNLFKTVVSFHAIRVLANPGEATRFVSVVTVLFILPFIVFSHVGGALADRFQKRNVIVLLFGSKVVLMLAATGFLFLGHLYALGVMVSLIEVNTALYVPSRLSLLSDMLDVKELSRGNGYIQTASLLGIILGTTAGGVLFECFRDRIYVIGLLLSALMTLAYFGSHGIKTVTASRETKKGRMFSDAMSASKGLGKDGSLLVMAFLLTFVNVIGAIFQTNILVWGAYVLRVRESQTGLLLLSLSLGLALGSVWAGTASGEKINLKLTPLGGLGITLTTLCLGLSANYMSVTVLLFLLGISGGFFTIPPQSYYQFRSPESERGMYISILEIITAVGFFLGGGILWLLGGKLGVGPDRMFIVVSALTLITTVWMLFRKEVTGT